LSATDATIDAIRDAVAPVIAGLGLELYDIELNGGGGTRTLRVTIDRAGGVDLDAITDVTRALSPVLDDDSTVPGSFLLEVSSPGVERTLRTPAHYRGAHGCTVSLKVRTETGTQRAHGVLVDSDDERCTIDTDGQREEFRYSDVTQARTVFEWGPQPRPGQRRTGQDAPTASKRARASRGASA
jgi:ribosome maturation factor RimP